jgi:hypothetical protein
MDVKNSDEIYKYSNPMQVIKNAKEYLGDSVEIYKSTHKGKKFMVYNPTNNKFVHFGAYGYIDFTKHKDINRRDNYLKRATHILGNWINEKYSPNNLSINILWK